MTKFNRRRCYIDCRVPTNLFKNRHHQFKFFFRSSQSKQNFTSKIDWERENSYELYANKCLLNWDWISFFYFSIHTHEFYYTIPVATFVWDFPFYVSFVHTVSTRQTHIYERIEYWQQQKHTLNDINTSNRCDLRVLYVFVSI